MFYILILDYHRQRGTQGLLIFFSLIPFFFSYFLCLCFRLSFLCLSAKIGDEGLQVSENRSIREIVIKQGRRRYRLYEDSELWTPWTITTSGTSGRRMDNRCTFLTCTTTSGKNQLTVVHWPGSVAQRHSMIPTSTVKVLSRKTTVEFRWISREGGGTCPCSNRYHRRESDWGLSSSTIVWVLSTHCTCSWFGNNVIRWH